LAFLLRNINLFFYNCFIIITYFLIQF
jgi:hypothetical protein